MFEQSLVVPNRTNKPLSFALSLGVQAAALTGLVLLPLVYNEQLSQALIRSSIFLPPPPAPKAPALRQAAAQAARHADGVFNRWFTEPLFRGTYPADVWEGYGPQVPDVRVGDMTQISQPIDSLGINYYTRGVVRSDPTRPFPHAVDVPQPGSRYTAMGWEVAPQGLHDILMRLHADYELKDLYVAENGAAFDDTPAPGPVVHDPERREYYAAHLEAVGRAVAGGVPLSGYMAWSLLDNFEWGWGYTRRFGIVHVDYPTQRRTPKSSALWYRDFIATQRP